MKLTTNQKILIAIFITALLGLAVYLVVCVWMKKCDNCVPPTNCAPPGQDVNDPAFLPNVQHPLGCCDGQNPVNNKDTGWKSICPQGGGGGGGSGNVSGKFPILKKFDLSNLNDFNVQVMSDSGSTNSCANYTKDGVFSRDGSLILKVTSQCGDGGCLNSGRVNSNDVYKFGVFEFDAKIPKCNQVFPAIWLLPMKGTYGGWPCEGEIDIIETTDTMPWGTFNIVAGQGGTGSWGNVDCSQNNCNGCNPYCLQSTISDWSGSRMYVGEADCNNKTWPMHKFVLYWEPGRLISYVDPVITRNSDGSISSITPSNVTDPNDSSIKSYKVYTFDSTPTWQAGSSWANNCYKGTATKYAPFDSPMNLMFNIAIGGYGGSKCQWGNKCNGDDCKNAVGSEMVISNITVYSLS
uniref:GH16 domain-containing protein n=1 Tax=viral metagenome TaxID=1070528 RepID=A0A6C0JMX2_9ZZZZ